MPPTFFFEGNMMTETLFKRLAAFTDIHFGKKNNDRTHNEDCLGFVEWFCVEAKKNNADTVIFLGDYFDNRNSLHLSTLQYGLKGMEKLNSLGIPVFLLVGNHDSYYKEKLDITSVEFANQFENIAVIDKITLKDKVLLCPWLVGNDWKEVKKLAPDLSYVFGHFELPTYRLNSQVVMPDHNGLKADHFKDVEFLTFSGHFHNRQIKNKVCYMGNTFPHDFADAWDDERGMMILDWGKTPQFFPYPKAPTYKTLNLSELLESPLDLITDLTYAKVTNDLDLSYDEVQIIRDVYMAQTSPRRFDISSTRMTEEHEFDDQTEFHSIDQIVIDGLMSIDSVTIKKETLVEIFKGLDHD